MSDDNSKDRLIGEMITYDRGMVKQIQHFLKVYEFAHLIGEGENLDKATQITLETAAILHDIGIRPALAKYGSSAGVYQEELGPAEADVILKKLGYPAPLCERVEYLIGHHHTYTGIDGIDYQILVEADFLVNLYEDDEPMEAVKRVRESIFRTKTGIRILDDMYGTGDGDE